ncbi:MAG TPA: hypothetical protein PKO45_13010 [Rubrivivax sp.]|nr:hypothetical protein [Rubrivivax sp.]
MAGLLDALNSRDGIFALGLLQAAAPQPVRQSLGGGLLSALGQANAWQQQQDDRASSKAEREQRAQMLALQMQQLQAQQAAQQRRLQYLGGLDPNNGPPMQATLPGAMAAGFSPQEAAALMPHGARAPEYKVVGGSLVQIGPNGVSEAYRAPDKPAAPSELARLLAEAQALPPGSPLARLYQQQIQKITTHAPPQTVVSLGSPVPVMLPDGSQGLVQPTNRPGEPPQLLRDPATGAPLRSGTTEKRKPIPSQALQGLAGNIAALREVDAAIEAVQRNPGALGLKNYLPDAAMQRIDPAGVDTRAKVTKLGATQLHNMAGSAMTKAELQRLEPYIPQSHNDPATALERLRGLRTEIQRLIDASRETYSADAGFQPHPLLTGPRPSNLPGGGNGGGLPSVDAIEAELGRRAGGR